jgi:conserved hypothetical protein|nr:MAG TPA: tail assembly chaperone protein [Caudoviricetes sp.]
MENKEFVIGTNKYIFRVAPFIETKNQATSLLALAKDSVKMVGDNLDVDIGQIIANIGNPSFQSVENFVLKYAGVVNENGKELLFKNVADMETHFNKNRSDYVSVIFEGLKFHFFDFFPDGLKSTMNIQALGAM